MRSDQCLAFGLALITTLVALPLAAATPATRASDTPPEPLSLAWCLERAQVANPQIAVAEAMAEATAHRVRAVGALDDPRFTYEASNLPVSNPGFDSTPLSGHQLALRQKLPFPGLLHSRRAAARAGSSAADLALEARRVVVAADVEAAWAELGFAQRALRITDRNIDFLRQLNAIAETKYRVGSGLQQDVLRAQVELTTRIDERLRRLATLATTSAALAALLDLPPATAFPSTRPLQEDASLPELDGLLARFEETSPLLQSLAAKTEEARRLERSAQIEGYPDFDLGLGYRVRQTVPGDPVNGDDFLSLGITIRLPVDRGKWRSRVAERGALLRREKARHRATRAELGRRIRTSHAELLRADAQTALLQTGLVPQARHSLESSRSGYEVGRIDFLSLLDSQVQLLNAELRRERAQADRRVAFATLEAAVGERLR